MLQATNKFLQLGLLGRGTTVTIVSTRIAVLLLYIHNRSTYVYIRRSDATCNYIVLETANPKPIIEPNSRLPAVFTNKTIKFRELKPKEGKLLIYTGFNVNRLPWANQKNRISYRDLEAFPVRRSSAESNRVTSFLDIYTSEYLSTTEPPQELKSQQIVSKNKPQA